MSSNVCIEFHDATIHGIRIAGPDALVDLRVFVHSSSGQPAIDAGIGWYQPAEMFLSDVAVDQKPSAWPLRVFDGVVTLGAERFANVVPLPFDRTGRVRVELQGDAGSLALSGAQVRIELKGVRGKLEEFRGIDR